MLDRTFSFPYALPVSRESANGVTREIHSVCFRSVERRNKKKNERIADDEAYRRSPSALGYRAEEFSLEFRGSASLRVVVGVKRGCHARRPGEVIDRVSPEEPGETRRARSEDDDEEDRSRGVDATR